MMILEGDEEDDLYKHSISENNTANGLLHFYKSGEKWNYLTQDEYEA